MDASLTNNHRFSWPTNGLEGRIYAHYPKIASWIVLHISIALVHVSHVLLKPGTHLRNSLLQSIAVVPELVLLRNCAVTD